MTLVLNFFPVITVSMITNLDVSVTHVGFTKLGFPYIQKKTSGLVKLVK